MRESRLNPSHSKAPNARSHHGQQFEFGTRGFAREIPEGRNGDHIAKEAGSKHRGQALQLPLGQRGVGAVPGVAQRAAHEGEASHAGERNRHLSSHAQQVLGHRHASCTVSLSP